MNKTKTEPVDLRPATPADSPAVAAIYGHHVLHGLGTFEEVPPDIADMAARMAAVLDAGLPWLVAEIGGNVVGYACARPYNPRSGYRFCVEDSVFVAADACGMGWADACWRPWSRRARRSAAPRWSR